jgi:regulator of RNase E activity RraA
MKLLGQAGTVTCMAGGNSAAHVAIAMARPGEVLVIDAGGFEGAAIWGGIMTRAAVGRNLGDLVIGDDDGVCVVPLERADTILAASLEKFAQEEQTNADTTAGTLPVDQMGFGEPEVIGD